MSTTVPPDCVAFVKVGFKLYACKGEFTVATYTTTTNTPETEVIQTDLQCATKYYNTGG